MRPLSSWIMRGTPTSSRRPKDSRYIQRGQKGYPAPSCPASYVGSQMATLMMAFKLRKEAQKSWRRLEGYKDIPLVLESKRFVDGELSEKRA